MMPESIEIKTRSPDLSIHPHLIGTIIPRPNDNGKHIIQGSWKYDAVPSSESQPFELIQTVSPVSELPIQGVYNGSFSIQYEDNGKINKDVIREEHVEISFTKKHHEYTVQGKGKNQYGHFKLVGKAVKLLGNGGDIESMENYSIDMYKVYNSREMFDAMKQIKSEDGQKAAHQTGHTHRDSHTNSALGDVQNRTHSTKHIHHHTPSTFPGDAHNPTHSPYNDRHMTRVDGKGLWRSWKRNFNSQFTAILDLVDNSLDASISNQNSGFKGCCYIDRDTYTDSFTTNRTVTGITLINNCFTELPPLQKCLEVYDSSKVHSGATHVGENGVGLKQACATLSDRSFVLVKNEKKKLVELGIIAEELQSSEGVYLPAFQFSTNDNLVKQMKDRFSQPKYSDVAQTIARYGAVLNETNADLQIGIARLCQHYDNICKDDFGDSPCVFAVIVDKVRSQNTHAITRVHVNDLLDELTFEIPRTYLHIPRGYDFKIQDRTIGYTYWQRRLVEFSQYTIKLGSTIDWKEWDNKDDAHNCTFRIYLGFDAQDVIDSEGVGSLFVYSRLSGRLITYHKDARTMLSLSAGGTEFCSGLRIILDDYEGHLPLNPTKQDVAFSEKAHGEIFRENLWRAVGSVAKRYYKNHIKKYGGKKTVLSRKIREHGEQMATENRLGGKELANLDLTTFDDYSYKVSKVGLYLEADEDIVGSDTIYRLLPETKKAGKKRKSQDVQEVGHRSRPVRQRSQQQLSQNSDSESEPDVEVGHRRPGRRRISKPLRYQSQNSDSDSEPEEDQISLPNSPKAELYKEELFSSDEEEPAKKTAKTTGDDLFGDGNDDEDELTPLKDKLEFKTKLLEDLTSRYNYREKMITELRTENNILARTVEEREREIADLKEQLSHIIDYEKHRQMKIESDKL